MKNSIHMKSSSTINFPFILLAVFLFFTFFHHLYRDARSAVSPFLFLSSSSPSPPPQLPPPPLLLSLPPPQDKSSSSSSSSASPIQVLSVLVPDWKVLVIVSPDDIPVSRRTDHYDCVFRNNAVAPARFVSDLPFTKRIAFKCEFPASVRRRLPFFQPVLMPGPRSAAATETTQTGIGEFQFPEMLRWNFLVYDSFTTENDVVLFVKGVNNRQGVNRPPSDFHCLFESQNDAVRTSVTSSIQEVFRCPRPDLAASPRRSPPKVSLEIKSDEIGAIRVPSVAEYDDREIAEMRLETKSLICACTMVYNAAKFLKEWVKYHASIGIERFIVYDNESNDDLRRVIDELAGEGYDVRSILWIWPKAQEAGFSHCALLARRICTWMIFIDVDEFVFSPSWLDSQSPSTSMLRSLLPPLRDGDDDRIGQVTINCNEFGPSDQEIHPMEGVTQGYTCRRRMEQRHKSIVLIDAIDPSLMNAIHHFELKEGYVTRAATAVVNHYKYQAWPEFKAKFRRRVSAYVVDWRQNLNLLSKDRAPGLGSQEVKPAGWEKMFCEVRDERLRRLVRRWFGTETGNGTVVMAWQG